MKTEKANRLGLFGQLHQIDTGEWRRAGGGVICEYCGMPYREHPYSLEYWDNWGDPFMTRICSGDLVKL